MFERLFGLKENGTTVRTEIVAGVTTFMTMAYILAVAPSIMTQTGMPAGGVFVASVGAAVAGTLFMAFFANYPFALAPGMGDIMFFTFGVVLGMGYSWQAALLAVFIDGVVFSALSLTRVRESVFNAVLQFLCSHYLVLDRIRFSLVTTVSFGFLLTTGCTAVLCFACGLDAMWIGFPLGAFLTMVALAVYCRVSTRRYSLLLLPEGTSAVFNCSFVPEAQQVVRARGDGERFLRGQGVGADVVSRIMLLIEECSMAVADASRRARHPLVEVSLIVDEKNATLVLRDTGITRDITDTDAQVKNLRDFVIAGLMSSYESCRYLNTIGCNRSVFSFRLKWYNGA